MRVIDLAAELGINYKTFRSQLTLYQIKQTNDEPLLVRKIRADFIAYNDLSYIQSKYRLDFIYTKSLVVDLIVEYNYPTYSELKEYKREGLTLAQICANSNFTVNQLRRYLTRSNIQYNYSFFFCEEIREMYCDRNLMPIEISNLLEIDVKTVSFIIRTCNIHRSQGQSTSSRKKYTKEKYGVEFFSQTPTMRKLSKRRKKYHHLPEITPELLQQQINQGKSLKQIARENHSSDSLLAQYCTRYNIQYTTKKEYLQQVKEQSYINWIEHRLNDSTQKYDYSLVTPTVWSNNQEVNRKIPIICPTHGVFEQDRWNHLSIGAGCPKCSNNGPSRGEQEVFEFVRSIVPSQYDVYQNDRTTIHPKELDILLPHHSLAIEYNGLYYHSSNNDNIKYQHLNKTERCANTNIQLLHIFENEWNDPIKQEIWKSMIRSKLNITTKIYARNTEVKKLTSQESNVFCSSNHIQGNAGCSVAYGLFKDSSIVAVATFRKARYINDPNCWEIIRYCSLLNHTVVGGFSKLLSHFERTLSAPYSIRSYANRRWSTGNLYNTTGFVLDKVTPPNYWYTKDCKTLEGRINYQKHKLASKLNQYDDNLTEKENMFNNGYRIIYDSGNYLFTKTVD